MRETCFAVLPIDPEEIMISVQYGMRTQLEVATDNVLLMCRESSPQAEDTMECIRNLTFMESDPHTLQQVSMLIGLG